MLKKEKSIWWELKAREFYAGWRSYNFFAQDADVA